MMFRTDIAEELIGRYKFKNSEINKTEVFGKFGVKRIDIDIKSEKVAIQIGKKKGRYISIYFEKNNPFENKDYLKRVVAKAIQDLTSNLHLSDNFSVLVAGLGNSGIVVDSLGAKTIDKILVTRQMTKQLKSEGIKIRDVSAYNLGVKGLTGISSDEVLRGLISEIKPELVMIIDSLSSLEMARIGKTFQITNTGIIAGSGTKKRGEEMSRETIGVPIITIGVPLMSYYNEMNFNRINEFLNRESIDLKKEKIKSEFLLNSTENLIVTTNNVDILIEDLSNIISGAINFYLLPEIVLE